MLPDTPALVAEDLTCIRNDRTLFSGLSFELRDSQALLLEGRNGSGKTSLLQHLAHNAPSDSYSDGIVHLVYGVQGRQILGRLLITPGEHNGYI